LEEITKTVVGLGAYFSNLSLFLLLLVYGYENISTVRELGYYTTYVALIYFGSESLLVIYLMFELTMVPILVIVLIWGRQPEKLSATYYAVVYTGLFSVPFLLVIVQIEGLSVSCYFSPLYVSLAYLIFLVKVPIFIVHLWLPKVHVEAPTSGSLLLAALLLKVGLYGFIKIIVLLNISIYGVLVASYIGIVIATLCAS
jgi:NADH-ubiquinone oxidoreductase chain 4